MSMQAIKFHPADEDYHSEQADRTDNSNFYRKAILLSVVVGIIIGLICKLILVSGRYYQGIANIEIKDVDSSSIKTVMARHLSSLQMFDKSFFMPGNTSKIRLADAIQKGDIRIVPSDSGTIAIFAVGDDKIFVRNLLKFLTESYISDFNENRENQIANLTRHQQQKLEQYRKLNEQYKALRKKLEEITQTVGGKRFDKAIIKYTQEMQQQIALSEQFVNKLSELNQKISQVRAELRNPTIRIDPDKLEKARKMNRMYTGDLNMLKLKHRAYMYYFKREAKLFSDSISSLRKSLRILSENVSKRLEMNLPAELTDDLLELNLAAELYEGKLARFQERWTRYFSKLTELLSDPREAKFSDILTVLSQLRQDLLKGSGQLPKKLSALAKRLQKGNRPAKRRGLSRLLIRNVARSDIMPQLSNCVELWNQTIFHLNRLFPDSNVRLKTLSRICSRLQSRLALIDRNIKYQLEREQLIKKKRMLQRQLAQLQLEFEQVSHSLINTYAKLSPIQAELNKIGKKWPEWEKLKLAAINLKGQLELASRELKDDTLSKQQTHEILKAGPILVTARNRLGVKAKNEFWISFLTGLIACGFMIALQLVIVPRFIASKGFLYES